MALILWLLMLLIIITDKREPGKKTAGMRHWSAKGDSQPASGSVTPASAKKKSAGSPFV